MTLPVDILGPIPFKLQYATNQPGSVFKELSPAEIKAGASKPPYFCVDGMGVRFQVEVDAKTTSGSKYARSELRECNTDGSLAGWDSSKGTHWMLVEGTWDHIPPGKPNLVGAQIHDAKNDRLEVLTDKKGVIVRVNGSSSGQPLLAPSVKAGDKYQILAVVNSGKVDVYYNDLTKPKVSFKLSAKGCYFKAGAYVNCSAKDAGSSKEYGAVVMTRLSVGHGIPVPTGGPVPTPVPVPTPIPTPDPVPVPTPTPTPSQPAAIMIIRHGEKPSDSSDHHLNDVGRARAQKLADLFGMNPPRVGLYRPDRLYASEGQTASRRPVETLQPLSDLTHMPEITKFDAAHGADLAKEIKGLNGVTLVCWAHTELVGIPKGLGTVSPKPPSSWPDDRFDVVWVFVRQSDGSWKFTQVPELVLAGDKNTVIK